MKNFNEEIEELAKQFNKSPIFDGIVNEEEYQNSKVKIMWILKDANSTGEDNSYDLRSTINNDLKTEYGIKKGWEKTFSNIIYVTNGILNQTKWDDIPFPKNQPEIIDILKQIAYVNIKKVGGGSQSVESELKEHFEKSKKLLLAQIEEFNPDVIIFGNTYRFFKNDLGLNQMNIFGTCHATAKANRIYINAYHPSQRTISGKEYFDDILKAYNIFKNQIKEINKLNDLSYSEKDFVLDANHLNNIILESIEQIDKINHGLIKNLKYEEMAKLKDIKSILLKAVAESKKLLGK